MFLHLHIFHCCSGIEKVWRQGSARSRLIDRGNLRLKDSGNGCIWAKLPHWFRQRPLGHIIPCNIIQKQKSGKQLLTSIHVSLFLSSPFLFALKRWSWYTCILFSVSSIKPLTVAARSKAWTVFARSITGIVGSNPTRDMDVCVRLFCVCVVLCVGSGLATSWSPVQGVLPTVYKKSKGKGKVVPVPNELSTRPWRRMGEWMYRFTFSWPLQ
jgi:hypothetical protein